MKTKNKIRKIIKQAISDYEDRYDEIYGNFYIDNPDISSGLLVMSEEQYIELQEKCDKSKKEIIDSATEEIMRIILDIVYNK